MRVSITQEDIDQGVRMSPSFCPLASAIGRQLGSPVNVCSLGEVGEVAFQGEDEGVIWYLSQRATVWANKFDRGKPVTPATFVLKAI